MRWGLEVVETLAAAAGADLAARTVKARANTATPMARRKITEAIFERYKKRLLFSKEISSCLCTILFVSSVQDFQLLAVMVQLELCRMGNIQVPHY
jgi:hypothetical protein